jgi:hypothetical protein
MRRFLSGVIVLLSLGASLYDSSSPAQAATSYVWIYPKAALENAESHDPGLYGELATGNGQTVYELMDPTTSGTGCKFTDNWPPISPTPRNFIVTEHEFSGDVTSLTVPSKTRAVLLDQESWGCTSSADHADPYNNDQNLASLASQANPSLTFTTAPGLDLFSCAKSASSCLQCPRDLPNGIKCQACRPREGNTDSQCYLDYDVAGMGALNASVIDIQAQSPESDSTTYNNFVKKAISQAKAANPSVTVLVGLTDNTGDCTPNCTAGYLARELETALKEPNGAPSANGAWINEPADNYSMMDAVVCSVLNITCS